MSCLMVNTKTKPDFGYTLKELTAKGANRTALEIVQQPRLWLAVWEMVGKYQVSLQIFLNKLFVLENLDIILTGAGTSAFIGNILEGPFQKHTRKHTRAVATTDLVSHPESYFHSSHPTLLISFARSGNSPESLAAVNDEQLPVIAVVDDAQVAQRPLVEEVHPATGIAHLLQHVLADLLAADAIQHHPHLAPGPHPLHRLEQVHRERRPARLPRRIRPRRLRSMYASVAFLPGSSPQT